LGSYLSEGMRRDAKINVYTSPFRRCLETTAGVLSALDRSESVTVECHPRVFETGGVYTLDADRNRGGPGQCYTAAEIKAKHPSFGVSQLPEVGQWYTGGWEDDSAGRARALEVAAWLRSPGFYETHTGSVVMMVMHGHFMDTLQKALLGIAEDPSKDGRGMNSFRGQAVQLATPNTATSFFDISSAGVVVRWIGGVDHLKKSAVQILSVM
jgi:broad specificity phosphatase PhoE